MSLFPQCHDGLINAYVRDADRAHGSVFSALNNTADIRKVLDYPQLVMRGDVEEIFKRTGVHTSAKCLEDMKRKIVAKSMSIDIVSTSKELFVRLNAQASSDVPNKGKRLEPFPVSNNQVCETRPHDLCGGCHANPLHGLSIDRSGLQPPGPQPQPLIGGRKDFNAQVTFEPLHKVM